MMSYHRRRAIVALGLSIGSILPIPGSKSLEISRATLLGTYSHVDSSVYGNLSASLPSFSTSIAGKCSHVGACTVLLPRFSCEAAGTMWPSGVVIYACIESKSSAITTSSYSAALSMASFERAECGLSSFAVSARMESL